MGAVKVCGIVFTREDWDELDPGERQDLSRYLTSAARAALTSDSRKRRRRRRRSRPHAGPRR